MSNFYEKLKKKYSEHRERFKYVQFSEGYENILKNIEEIIDKNKEFFDIFNEDHMYRIIENYIDNTIGSLLNEKQMLEDIIARTKIVRDIINKLDSSMRTIILAGANGSGKSSLADFLKQNLPSKIIVFPAQKFLNIDINESYEIRYDKERIQGDQFSLTAKNIFNNYGELQNRFLKSIRALVNEYMTVLYEADKEEKKREKREKCSFDNLKSVYKKLIPEIELEIDPNNRLLYPKKNGIKYDFNLLSEGEKVIILYIIDTLLAKENSYIIIDEPESYLNLSLVNKLWDSLIEIRSDCSFIFVSHNIDFINSRNNLEFIWCKNYFPPQTWELEKIDKNKEIPQELIIKLIGSKKPIILCEGDYSSLDYQVYSKLFSDFYTITPVKGHREVINYTKAYNNILKNQVCYGIIDGDLIVENIKIDKLAEENIIILNFNEIEMFLLQEEIIKTVIRKFNLDEKKVEEKFNEYKEEFLKKINEKKEKIVLDKLKKEIDGYFKEVCIKDYKSYEQLKENYLNIIGNISLDEKKLKYMEKINDLHIKKDYRELLKWCSLKKEISRELANRKIDSDYENKALGAIETEENLKKYLIEKYFSKIKI